MSLLIPLAMILMLMSWLQPMHIPPWLSWHSEQLAFLSTLIAATPVCFAMQKVGSKHIEIPRIVLMPLAIIGLIGLQCILGQIDYIGDGLTAIFYLTMFIIAAIAAGAHVYGELNNRKTGLGRELYLDWLACTVAVGMVASLFIALSQALQIWQDLTWIHRTAAFRRPGGNLGQANNLATLAAIGLAGVFYLYDKKILSNASVFLLIIAAFQVIAISESRTGIVSVGVLIAWRYYFNRPNSRKEKMQTIFGAVIFGGLVWSWPKIINAVQSGGFENFSETVSINTAAGARAAVWPQLWEATLLKPWLGWGWGGVSKAHNGVLDQYSKGEPFTYAHNIFLDLSIGFGLPFALIILILLMVWFFRCGSQSKDVGIRFCSSIIIPVAIHSLTEYPFAYSYFLFLVGMAVGVMEKKYPLMRVYLLNGKYFSVLVLIVFSVWVLSIFDYLAMEDNYRVSRFVAQKIGQPQIGYQPQASIFFNQLESQAATLVTVVTPNMKSESIIFLKKASMRFPYYATQNRYALALALNGEIEEAERQLKVMKAMHGEQSFSGIKDYWIRLSEDEYPQLKYVRLP